ncbi:hypothetical protein EXIGLDRAFT_835266 [Exidia glandulosa HHB12029]|uniref:Mitochondrial escape protein 2 n=1 Tax=Exidia glandulosa HHB12029 TaxID=1314781 RepID=A0A165IYI9_EXIGL|nr:hypothetical protein EXIGLDRAFT_835266 [Exidia glandulosa HHB12029]
MLRPLRTRPLWIRAQRRAWPTPRFNATVAVAPPIKAKEQGTLFFSGVFPLRLSLFDIRYYLAAAQKDELLGGLRNILDAVSAHGFAPLKLESHPKNGGVFVQFEYEPGENALQEIRQSIYAVASKQNGFRTWLSMLGFNKADVWVVKGQPWLEDLNRYVSPFVKVEFEGPDVHEEDLYTLMRPYGRIHDITAPQPVPAGTLRSSTVSFTQLRSAAVAHNCIHGLSFHSEDGKETWLKTSFERTRKAHWIRDWIVAHPRVSLPIALFLFGTLTYTIFDPIRMFFVEGKMLGWFNYNEFSVVKWLRANTIDRFMLPSRSLDANKPRAEAWKDREQSEDALKAYLADFPGTVTFVSGPAGSGKTSMTETVVKHEERRAMVIDCAELFKGGSDSSLLSSLARQTGYWPLFAFVNNLNSMIDLASVGLIGQKTGFNASLEQQVRDMLQVVASGLQGVTSQHDKDVRARERAMERKQQQQARAGAVVERIKRGAYHDGRMDCIAGNGIMSELGFGDEPMGENDFEDPRVVEEPVQVEDVQQKIDQEVQLIPVKREDSMAKSVPEAVKALPVVVIKNFAAPGSSKDEILSALAEWAGTLVDNDIAHVIVLSDNRENVKRLAKAMPTKPLANITLSDADPETAISYVSSRLAEAGHSQTLTKEQIARVQMLGGRASDLQTLIHKVRSGQRVEEAVDDIISRGVGELMKNAFGDDLDDAKNLPWTREQAWSIVRQLANKNEISYFDVLLEFPFKGDETALRALEHHELIAIHTRDGRPSSIRPGRPVHKFVFQRLVHDPVFQATQDLAYNEKAIASAEATVKTCEAEMSTLRELAGESSTRRAANTRAKYVSAKMQAAQSKIEQLEYKNAALMKVITRET